MPKYQDTKKEVLQELTTQHRGGYLSIPCVMGPVGLGKTEMAVELVDDLSKLVGDELLIETIATGEASDPTDTAGIPWVVPGADRANPDDLKALWVLNSAAYRATKVPTLLFFDDIDKASSMVVNSLLNIFVHRRFKDFTLHPKSMFMAAGNRGVDDKHAHELSESMKTRITVIELEPSFVDFAEYAKREDRNGNQMIHPILIGFLASKPALVHAQNDNVFRFPTPRGWREATLQMNEFPAVSGFKRILERKVGVPAASDFWGWYTIFSQIDVEHILSTGKLLPPKTVDPKVPAEVTKKISEFAAVYALTAHLNQKYRGDYKGLEPFCDEMAPELRVAFLLQIEEKMKRQFQKDYPKTAGKIMATIIKDSE